MRKGKVMNTMVERNRTGQMEEFNYCDEEGRPVLNDYGIAKKTQEYDDKGNIDEERFYGLSGETVT